MPQRYESRCRNAVGSVVLIVPLVRKYWHMKLTRPVGQLSKFNASPRLQELEDIFLKLLFLGIPSFDSKMVPTQKLISEAVNTNQMMIKQLTRFKEEVGGVPDDDAPTLARSIGAMKELFLQSGIVVRTLSSLRPSIAHSGLARWPGRASAVTAGASATLCVPTAMPRLTWMSTLTMARANFRSRQKTKMCVLSLFFVYTAPTTNATLCNKYMTPRYPLYAGTCFKVGRDRCGI